MVVSITPARNSTIDPGDPVIYRNTSWGASSGHNLSLSLVGPTFTSGFTDSFGVGPNPAAANRDRELIIVAGVAQPGFSVTHTDFGGGDHQYEITRDAGWPDEPRAIVFPVDYVSDGTPITATINGVARTINPGIGDTGDDCGGLFVTLINGLGLTDVTAYNGGYNTVGYAVGAIVILLGVGLTSLTVDATLVSDRRAPIRLTTGGDFGATIQNLWVNIPSAPADPVITTTTLPGGVIGVAYSSTVEVEDGTEPYAWSIASGALPPGVTIDAGTGSITGTPTTVGVYAFTVQVDDDASGTDTQALSITIGSSLNIITTSVAQATVGAAYSDTVEAAGGTAPYTWALAPGSPALPAGLSLDANTGAITGTPTTPGRVSVVVRCTDSE